MGWLSLIYIPNDLIFFKLIFCAIFEILLGFLASFRSISLAFAVIHCLRVFKKSKYILCVVQNVSSILKFTLTMSRTTCYSLSSCSKFTTAYYLEEYILLERVLYPTPKWLSPCYPAISFQIFLLPCLGLSLIPSPTWFPDHFLQEAFPDFPPSASGIGGLVSVSLTLFPGYRSLWRSVSSRTLLPLDWQIFEKSRYAVQTWLPHSIWHSVWGVWLCCMNNLPYYVEPILLGSPGWARWPGRKRFG